MWKGDTIEVRGDVDGRVSVRSNDTEMALLRVASGEELLHQLHVAELAGLQATSDECRTFFARRVLSASIHLKQEQERRIAVRLAESRPSRFVVLGGRGGNVRGPAEKYPLEYPA